MKFYEYCYNVLVRFSSGNAPRSENSWGLDQSITLLLTPQNALDVARDFVNCQSELEAFDFTFDHFSLCEFKKRNWFWIIHFNVTPKDCVCAIKSGEFKVPVWMTGIVLDFTLELLEPAKSRSRWGRFKRYFWHPIRSFKLRVI